ncbi:enoyl-CoA hydratase [Aeromicrobium sp. PE09-221]|uniref:enoyl-CoA hydratase-related protein n=1 Tax=Aeromicrobium sp. PE09-221 TaxID=1898043 RepID=UPI000B3E8C4D|nr:enoyl-CoA hydratase-related protein [Aeromicrobium sp. PE09-221]OUZ09697.1 enoyl-CoA hydratase [Aeromicrobium sp. PE09-221]
MTTSVYEGDYATITVSVEDRIGRIGLDRSKALNVLNSQVMEELVSVAERMDTDPAVGVILLRGSPNVFAAGGDIAEMSGKEFAAMYAQDWFSRWQLLGRLRTPIVAAVAGYALGGGCELAMMADVIVAAESARFGQPEIALGVIPGMGGTQRLVRAVGKAKAMDMILTGRQIDADEAERIGLVSRVVADDELDEAARAVAAAIAGASKPAAQMAKEAVSAAFETGLEQGLVFERRIFHSLFATEDQREGMAAFAERRSPRWRHR